MLASVTVTLLNGLATTLELFILTLLFAIPLGLIISFGSMAKITPVSYTHLDVYKRQFSYRLPSTLTFDTLTYAVPRSTSRST